jgi:ABC-type dipeptide/oligopeptide/nickel transport system permease subunit
MRKFMYKTRLWLFIVFVGMIVGVMVGMIVGMIVSALVC